MSRSVVVIISLLIAVLVALGVYDFYQTHEYKEVTKRSGFLGEARTNPLYAARLFLKRMGIPSETKTSLQGIGAYPDTNTVILLDTRRTTLSPAKIDTLIDWVETGGHLITKASDDWRSSEKIKDDKDHKELVDDVDFRSLDPLQRHLGVRTNRGKFIDKLDETFEQLEGLVSEALEENNIEENIPTIDLIGTNRKLGLQDRWFREIQVHKDKRNITEEVELGGSNYIVRQKLDRGMVTLVSDMKFIENKRLDKADHAEILWYLVHGLQPVKPAAVWLIHNDEMPALWKILWKYAWAFILSLVLLFLAWLLSSTRRFGPLIPKAEEDRRSIKENINSSGNYYWKNNDRKKLLESTRNALSQRLSRIHPGWSQRDQQEQALLIAEQMHNQTPENIYTLLFSNDKNLISNAEKFTNVIKQIEMIRKSI